MAGVVPLALLAVGGSSGAQRGMRIAGAPGGTGPWSFVDGAVCITTGNEKRIASSEVAFRAASVAPVIYRVDRDAEDGARGCYNSHLEVFRSALESGFNNLLVFEDNIRLGHQVSEAAVAASRAFVTERAYDVLYVGYFQWVPGLRVTRLGDDDNAAIREHILRVLSPSAVGTTAYVISRRGMEKLVALDESHGYVRPVDNVFGRELAAVYGVHPVLFHRSAVPSLVNPTLDLPRLVLFSPPAQEAVEAVLVRTGSTDPVFFAFYAAVAWIVLGSLADLPVLQPLLAKLPALTRAS